MAGSKVGEATDRHWGFNAQSEQYEDLVNAGVIDPTKVVRTALTNASSIASVLLTTEALVSEIPQKEKPAPPPHGHGWTITDRKSRRAGSRLSCPSCRMLRSWERGVGRDDPSND